MSATGTWNNHGFSLLEVMVGVVIMVIVSTIAITRFNLFSPEEKLRKAARTIIGASKMASELAISSGTNHRLRIDLDANICYLEHFVSTAQESGNADLRVTELLEAQNIFLDTPGTEKNVSEADTADQRPSDGYQPVTTLRPVFPLKARIVSFMGADQLTVGSGESYIYYTPYGRSTSAQIVIAPEDITSNYTLTLTTAPFAGRMSVSGP